ncbi:MAG: putative domain HDIG-containing protein [Frankiales bacterium]|nr:putative domain HDIG-containing protein [Frankiales bacterium]
MRLFVAAVLLAAAGAVGLMALWLPAGGSGLALLVFAALAVAAEVIGEDVYGSSTVSLSAVPVLAAACAGEPGAALVAAAAAGIVTTARAGTRRVEQFLFNPAVLMVCAALACLVTRPAVGHALPFVVVAGVVAGVGYFALNNGLVAVAIGLDQHRSPREVLRAELSWLLPSFVGYGLLAGLLGAAFTLSDGWGVLAFLVPPALMRHGQRQVVLRTEKSVKQLKAAHRELREAHASVVESHRSTAAALAQAIEARDSGTGGHVVRVTRLATAMLALVDPDLAADEHLSFGFLLHDVGKIGVPDAILRKPGPLTFEERAVMDKHPAIGHRIVSQAGFSDVVGEIVLTHHERWDGLGYPQGLRGEEIPLATRLFAVADSLDAMTDDRIYRTGMTLDEAIVEVVQHSGTQFDPLAVDVLCRMDRALVAELLQLDRQRVITLV